jgi:ribonuclease PH
MKQPSKTNRRRPTSLRPVDIRTGVNIHAEGSALIAMGDTRVLCTASVENRIPDWLRGKGRGWVTAEYGMLPRATTTRNRRERDKTPSRSLEISRLVGRSLRAAVNLEALGERLITVDCDVLQADGGTRTAAITGGMVALALACRALRAEGLIAKNPVVGLVAAVSVGIIDGEFHLDLDYDLDHRAEVDMNLAMNARGEVVEIQASAEGRPFPIARLRRLEDLAAAGIKKLIAAQRKALKE